MTNEEIRITARRLLVSRTSLVSSVPFFSRLLLKLKIGVADCETAYTDMENVVFDPAFAKRLSDTELEFVFLHEVLHCVLDHCIRGRGLNSLIYNIACDIVVNSVALDILGFTDFTVDKSPVMHLTVRGTEGREHTAEDIYQMLFKATPNELEDFCKFNRISASGGDGSASDSDLFGVLANGGCVDSHGEWESIENTVLLRDKWNNAVRQASRACARGSGMPAGLERYFKNITAKSEVDWKQVLHDFIKHNRADYTYSIPDRRFDGDIIMPSFQENICGKAVSNVWFLIDTSGSVSDDEIATVYGEIASCISQMDNLAGRLSFFDTKVSTPVDFTDEEELFAIKPKGGGGTSFFAIFDYLDKSIRPEERPEAIVILTDGYASFPKEEAAMGIPVIWIIYASGIVAPWGTTACLD